jgi:hypothetical protein
MDTSGFQRALAELKGFFESFKREMSHHEYPGEPSLPTLFVSRVMRAIDEGLQVLEAEFPHRSSALTPKSTKDEDDSFLIEALSRDLDREESGSLRWLAVSYSAALRDCKSMCAHLEVLVARKLDELCWLVAGLLWFQWDTGIPAAPDLRLALARVRKSNPGVRCVPSSGSFGVRRAGARSCLHKRRTAGRPIGDSACQMTQSRCDARERRPASHAYVLRLLLQLGARR